MAKRTHTQTTVSRLPRCDFHPDRAAHWDGKTKQGPWANMCDECFPKYGTGLGLGHGQALVVEGERHGAELFGYVDELGSESIGSDLYDDEAALKRAASPE